jgi:uncharacterized PurR-regulated membrane protein YhhQ (DUF165 family)
MRAIRISVYLLAFILSNLIVLKFGSYGLIFTALFLIPFDFVMRCIFHETWSGMTLIKNMGLLVASASIITILINYNSLPIAMASMFGFIAAQIGAGLFYQKFIKSSQFIKVNGSDFIGILLDSVVFQLVAFSVINPSITISQVLLKIVGGLFWYWILFKKFKIKI